MLGSTATHTRSGFGGFRGRALQAGDRLPVANAQPGPPLAVTVQGRSRKAAIWSCEK
jgi:allophanate hydrolase subunit 2